MNKEKLQLQFNINPEKLTWAQHSSGLYDFAVIGDYVIYHELSSDIYTVTRDNSILQWRVNLGALV